MMIKTQNLWKIYEIGNEKVQVQALRGVDLEVEKGEYLAIMGPSGSGKSTLMNLIGCLDTPTQGEYYLNSRLVSQMNDDELAFIRNKEIGFVFQTFNLLPRTTVLRNVMLPLLYTDTSQKDRETRARESLKYASRNIMEIKLLFLHITFDFPISYRNSPFRDIRDFFFVGN